jgi:hypothetical protein
VGDTMRATAHLRMHGQHVVAAFLIETLKLRRPYLKDLLRIGNLPAMAAVIPEQRPVV